MEIVKGKIQMPVKAVTYGPEGIGKTTFASQWPTPLFLDIENGSYRLDVARITPKSAEEVFTIIDNLTQNTQGYRTLVIDTADWLEKMISELVCIREKKSSIEAFDYGKGWVKVSEEWKRLLDKLDTLRKTQAMNILFLAHSAIKHLDPPDQTGYDRYEMKLSKQGNGILKEWADLLLFANYDTFTVEKDGKKKAEGGKRVMYAEHSPCWDAKNRFGLASKLKFEFSEIAGILLNASPAPVPVSVPVVSPVEPPKAENPQPQTAAPAIDPEKAKLLEQLQSLCKTSGVTLDELKAEVARKGVATIDMRPSQYNINTLQKIVSNWDAIKTNIITTRGAK